MPLLFDEARANDHPAIRGLLKEWIPTYRPFEMENIGLVTDEAPEAGTAGVGGVSYTGAGSLNYNWLNADRDDDELAADEADETAADDFETAADDVSQPAIFVERRQREWSSHERTTAVERRQNENSGNRGFLA